MLIDRESRFEQQSVQFVESESRQQYMEDKIERLCTTQDVLTDLMQTELRLIKDHIARIDSSLSGTNPSTRNSFMCSNVPTKQNVRYNTQPMGSSSIESSPMDLSSTESQPTESQPTESQPDMVEFSESGLTSQACRVPHANAHPANRNLINETVQGLAAGAQVNERDPTFVLVKNDHIIEEIDEWYKSTCVKMSIHQRNLHYNDKWRKTSTTYGRKAILIKFIHDWSPRVEEGKLSLRQLGWLVDVYKKRNNLTLANFTAKKCTKVSRDAAMSELTDIWLGLSDRDRQWVYEIGNKKTSDLVEILQAKRSGLEMLDEAR